MNERENAPPEVWQRRHVAMATILGCAVGALLVACGFVVWTWWRSTALDTDVLGLTVSCDELETGIASVLDSEKNVVAQAETALAALEEKMDRNKKLGRETDEGQRKLQEAKQLSAKYKAILAELDKLKSQHPELLSGVGEARPPTPTTGGVEP